MDLHRVTDQFLVDLSALQKTQMLFEKIELHILATLLPEPQYFHPRLAATSSNFVLCVALLASSIASSS